MRPVICTRLRTWVLLTAVMAVSVHPALAWAADVEDARRAIAEMYEETRHMQARERSEPDATAAAERAIAAGERALEAVPKPGNRHARDAAEHIRAAIESIRRATDALRDGRSTEVERYIKRGQRALRQAAGHAEAL